MSPPDPSPDAPPDAPGDPSRDSSSDAPRDASSGTPSGTEAKLLEAGLGLMLSGGYAATAIDDVCRSAGVSKGSFYHFFESKEEFGLAVLDAYYQRGVARVRGGEYMKVADPGERLEGFLDHMERISPDLWRHGCLMGAFATELAERSPSIRERVGELFDALREDLVPIFLPVIGDPEEARELGEEMLAYLEGNIVLARAHGEPERIARAVRRFRKNLAARMGNLKELEEGKGSMAG